MCNKKDAGMDVDLKWCVLIFFGLSFVFQMGVSAYSFVAKKGYYSIFHNDILSGKDTAVDTMPYRTLLEMPADERQIKLWTDDILRFNWARFVEYTFSGSLVLFTIALIAGISDFEILLLIYVLSAACMLMGLGAEYCMRIMYALKVLASSPASSLSNNARDTIVSIIIPQLRASFWILHLFAWVCILAPWYVCAGPFFICTSASSHLGCGTRAGTSSTCTTAAGGSSAPRPTPRARQ